MADVTIGGLESAAPTDATASSRRHFPAFDGFRAIAATTVLVTHVSFVTRDNRIAYIGAYVARMDIGVAIFFLISGFLLYRPFVVAHLDGRARPDTRSFFRRRFLRIFPAYWLALAAVFYVFHTQRQPGGVRDFLVYFGLLQIYSRAHILGGITQAWSLCTEISFYLFLPLYAFVLRRLARRSNRVALTESIGLVALFVSGLAFRLWVLLDHPGDYGRQNTWLPAYLDMFAIGMALGLASAWRSRRGRDDEGFFAWPGAAGACWALAGLCFWVVATKIGLPRDPFAHPLTTWQWMARQVLYGVTALFLLLPGIFGPQDRGVVRRALRNPIVQWLGLVSYGVYLWHELWLDRWLPWTRHHLFAAPFATTVGGVAALTVASAAFSYYVLERPVLRLKDRRRDRQRSRP